MKYIDKGMNCEEGNKITEDYLDCCRTQDPITGVLRWQNIEYDGSFVPFKKWLVDVLMVNQQRYCCYCMRKLNSKQRVTLEHIIPQNVNHSELCYYQRAAELDRSQIALTGEFVHADSQKCPPYPHTVAYNNLVVSCDGTFPDAKSPNSSCCCNEKRGNAKAFPIYYIERVGTELLDYQKNGTVVAKIDSGWSSETCDVINNIKLNCKSLVDIRRLWYLLRNQEYRDICACSDYNKRRYLLSSVLFDTGMDAIEGGRMFNKFMKQDYWRTFMLYHWFYKYFSGGA